MPKIVYPRPCPDCGTKINDRFNFSRHRRYCGKKTRVPCPHCPKTFCRKDKMTEHVKKVHSATSEGGNGKKRLRETAEPSPANKKPRTHDDRQNETTEPSPTSKKPRLHEDQQTGGAVSSRGTKREVNHEQKQESKISKQDDSEQDDSDSSEEETSESDHNNPNPVFVVNVKKLGPAKRWKKDVVINQKFIMTLDQQRPPSPLEDINIEATYAIAVAMDGLIKELKIPMDYWMTLQIGSREHRKEEGLTGETWKIPVADFAKRAEMAEALMNKIALVLNSGEFITRDVGFSASVLFSRPERKGGKTGGGGPGLKIWSEMVKQSRSICEIKNKDDLCCARAIVVMREYAYKQAGEPNSFHNIYLDRGEKTMQLKEAKKLHFEAEVPEGLCGLAEVEKFQEHLGPLGYRIIVIEASRGGVIFKGEKFGKADKTIALVKSAYVDEESGLEKAHFDGLYSIPGFINRSYFCKKCCKGYDHEDSKHHRCQAKTCPACKRTNGKCKDFTLWAILDRSCRECKREFYGEDCFLAHKNKSFEESKAIEKVRERMEKELGEKIAPVQVAYRVCSDYRRCSQCRAEHRTNTEFPHKCLHAECKNCLEFVQIFKHKCFIISEKEKKLKKLIRRIKAKEQNEGKVIKQQARRYTCSVDDDGNPDKEEMKYFENQIKKRLNDFKYITNSVPQEEREEEKDEEEVLQEKIVTEMLKEGFSPSEITAEAVNERLPPEVTSRKVNGGSIIFADIECLLDESNTFQPILICYAKGSNGEIFHHWGPNCVTLFLKALHKMAQKDRDEERKRMKLEPGKGQLPKYTVFFHNLKGFDGVLTLNALYSQNLKVTQQMGTGTKVLHFKHANLTFKDSLNFLNMPLSAFPRTFGLTELKKGFFPHKFSKMRNLLYEGQIPELKFFEPQHMSEDKKKECEDWHAKEVTEGKSWNFQQEMLEYCKSDVELLRQGCLKFAQDTQKEAGFNPLTQCITIASTCHYFWRNYQMEPKTIAIEPINGWGGAKVNQSKVAMQWLYLKDLELGGNRIKHTRNGGEQVLLLKGGKVHVDGYDPVTKTVFEFHGCEWHGCPKCKPLGRQKTAFHHPDRTIEENYRTTQWKIQLLKEAGYNVEEKWECDFKKELKESKELQEKVNNMSWVTPLDPRDAFYGGRTGLSKAYYSAEECEEILYNDFTSLYPTINKYGVYPIGHPDVRVNPVDQSIHSHWGIVKADVLPPEKLLHPVLPVKYKGKLLFPLCLKCVKDQEDLPWHERTNTCPHTDEERKLRDTWCSLELEKAVEKGYRVLKIHEVYHWPENQRKKGLFADYVNTWLKHKTEASNWPSKVKTEEEQQEYIRKYRDREGIELDSTRIEKNPGRKQVAKLMLNSFWGKFGENEHRVKIEEVCDENVWQRLVQDDTIVVKDVRVFNNDVMEVATLQNEDACASSGKINVFIACFTTAQARLKLYEELEKLGDQVLYYDTDSVIYSCKEGQIKIPTGVFLGDMTDELEGDTIKEFGSAGPKSYCYETQGGKTECKNKGTKSSFEINQKLNCESMMNHIKKELTDPLEKRRIMDIEIKNHFVRDGTKKTVSLVELKKAFGVNWDKRVIEKDTGKTYPYGYVRI